MRHALSLLLGIVLAPVIWTLTGLGINRYGRSVATLAFIHGLDSRTVIGIALLLAAGLLCGVLLGTRLSPLGPAFVGLAYLAASIAFLIDYRRVLDLLPNGSGATTGAYENPLVYGLSWLLGAAFLVPLVVPSRWRRKARPVPPQPAAAVPGDQPQGPAGYGDRDRYGAPADDRAPVTPGYGEAGREPYGDRADERLAPSGPGPAAPGASNYPAGQQPGRAGYGETQPEWYAPRADDRPPAASGYGDPRRYPAPGADRPPSASTYGDDRPAAPGYGTDRPPSTPGYGTDRPPSTPGYGPDRTPAAPGYSDTSRYAPLTDQGGNDPSRGAPSARQPGSWFDRPPEETDPGATRAEPRSPWPEGDDPQQTRRL